MLVLEILYYLNIVYGLLAHANHCLSMRPMEKVNLQPIMDELQNCIVFIFQVGTTIDYSKIQVPFVLTVCPLEQLVLRYNSTIHHSLFESVTPVRPKIYHPGNNFKLTNLVCNATFITAGEFTRASKFKSSSDEKFVMNVVLKIRQDMFHAQIFVLFPEVETRKEKYSGYYACWFYDTCMIEFSCSCTGCLGSMRQVFNVVTNFGRKIKLGKNWITGQTRTPQFYLGSPLQRKKFSTLHQTLDFFLFEYLDSNFTLVQGSRRIRSVRLPSIDLKYRTAPPISPDIFGIEIVPVSYRSGFNFITSDAVTGKQVEISLYTNPLELPVWLSLLGAIILVAGVLSLEKLSFGLRKTFSNVTFDLFAALVEQEWKAGEINSDTFK
ncbi:unnamed protein product, partial [Allacma fusca]